MEKKYETVACEPTQADLVRWAVEDADRAFWAAIVALFPQVQSGDFPPDAAIARNAANLADVTLWLTGNLAAAK